MKLKETLWNRNFAALWAGQVVSQLGSQAAQVAIALWVLETTGSTRLMGLILAVSTAPVVLLGPFAGAMADRRSRRSLVMVSDGVRGLVVLALAALIAAAPLSTLTFVLIGASLLNGIMTAVFRPAVSALLPSIVPASRLAVANALSQSSAQACALLGLAFGGIAYVHWGAPTLLAVDGLSFLAAAAATAVVREPGRPVLSAPMGGFAEHLKVALEGWGWIERRAGMRSLLMALTAANLLFMPVYVLLPLYVRDHLRVGNEWYGVLLAAAAVGALPGLASVGWWRPAAVSAAPLLVAGVACSALAMAPTPFAAGALLALVGAASSRFNVLVVTEMQTSAPESLRGRVMALVVTVSAAAAPLGLLLGSLAGDVGASGLRLVILGCGAGMSLAAMGCLVTAALARSRQRRESPRAPLPPW